MNRKGFTLIELLAVIIILSLLAVLASTSVTKIVTNSKSELYDTQIKLIKEAAMTWGADNLNRLPSEEGSCKYLSLGDLKRYGLLDSSIINPKTNKEFSDNLYIKIYSKKTDFGTLITEYEVDSSDITSCTPIYEKICTLVSDTDNSNSITIGDKYQCKVKDDMEADFEDGYYFYVLSKNEDSTVNLIMDRNINNGIYNFVSWINTDDYGTLYPYDGNICWVQYGCALNDKGPITAMTYLYNATKDWTNIPPLNYEYYDKDLQESLGIEMTGGYESFISEKGVGKINGVKFTEEEPLRARMPIYVFGDDGIEYGEVSNKKDDDSNSYLYENLEGTGMDGIFGYWTLSTVYFDSSSAFHVYADGTVYFDSVTGGGSYGVRPVITLPAYNLSNLIK